MGFPRINMDDWVLIERDDLWITFKSDGVQKYAGKSLLYGRKGNDGNNFKQFLYQCDVYGRGILVMTWVLVEISGDKILNKAKITKMLKDGEWVTGVNNAAAIFYPFKDSATGRDAGFRIELQTGPKIFSKIIIRKDGGAVK